MNKYPEKSCEKCGGTTSIRWDNGEKSSGMDIRPLRLPGMIRTCQRCGYEEKDVEDGSLKARLSELKK